MSVSEADLKARFAPHFDPMRPEDRARIAAALEVHKVRAGTRLLQHGAENDRLHLIAAGQVQITLDCPTTTLKLGFRGPGSWVGELGLIDPGPASANVDVTQDLEAWILSNAAWRSMRQAAPGAAAALTELVCTDVAARLRATDTLSFRREGDRVILAQHAEKVKESLLDHLRRMLGFGGAR